MHEIITYGGGEILVDVFNGIAMMAGMSTYLSAIKIAFTVGMFFTLFKVAFGYSFTENIKFVAGFILIYNMIFLPKTDIIIIDRINPNIVGATVDNVPYGLALFASLTSRIGDKLTTLAEMNYSLPNDLQYHKNGMLMGSKLVDMSTDFYVTNSEFAKNLREYSKQCIFYDILLGKYTFDNLKDSANLWATVSANPSPARSFTYTQNGNESIVTCQFGTAELGKYWPTEIDNSSKKFGMSMFPNSGTAIEAKNKLLASLPISYDYLLNISQGSLDIIQQNMMINILKDSTSDFASSTGGLYAEVKAEAQLRSASKVTAQLASKWVPLLKIVFECLFYGAFPFVFLMMLMPSGFGVFKNYFSSFMWLQSWGILYAILHRIMMSSASSSGITQTLLLNGSNAITLSNQGGVQALNSDIATVAGYLSMSIPFISMALVKGASVIAGMSDSLLNTPQSVASQTSAEVASGNISLGNASIGNRSYANLSANKQDADAFMAGGGIQIRNSDGSSTRQNADGSMTSNMSGMASTYLTNLNGNQAISNQLSKEASKMKQAGTSLSTQASSSRGQAYSAIAQHTNSQSINNSGNESWRKGTNKRTADSLNNIQTASQTFAKTHGLSEEVAGKVLAEASAGIGFGKFQEKIPLLNKLPNINGRLTSNIGYSDVNSQIYNDAKSFAKSENLQESFDVASTAGKSQGYTFTDSKGNSLNNNISSNLNEASNLDKRAGASFSMSKGLSERASEIRSGSVSVNSNLNKEFQDYSVKQLGHDGRPLGFEKFNNIMKSPSADRERLLNRFIEMKSDQIANDYKGKFNVNENSLKNDYKTESNYLSSDTSNKIDNKYADNNNRINDSYYDNANGKSLNNDQLKKDVEDQIEANRSKISRVEINSEAMDSVQNKHGESIKKSFLDKLDNE